MHNTILAKLRYDTLLALLREKAKKTGTARAHRIPVGDMTKSSEPWRPNGRNEQEQEKEQETNEDGSMPLGLSCKCGLKGKCMTDTLLGGEIPRSIYNGAGWIVNTQLRLQQWQGTHKVWVMTCVEIRSVEARMGSSRPPTYTRNDRRSLYHIQ